MALQVFNLLDGVGFGQDKQENATPLLWPLEVANASSKVADVILSATRFIYKLQATAISHFGKTTGAVYKRVPWVKKRSVRTCRTCSLAVASQAVLNSPACH